MKYRIIKIGDKYYPQYKTLWWWNYFWDSGSCYEDEYRKGFSELSFAVEFIREEK
jgi:hypothetical protein